MQDDKDIKETVKKVIKMKVKEELKEELKQELLDEIYKELLEESKQNEDLKTIPPKKSSENTKINQSSTNISIVEKKNNFKTDSKENYSNEVFISVQAILKIASHALKYANSKIPANKWVEVIGLLAGKLDKKRQILHIEDAYPLGHGNAVAVKTKHERNKLSGHERVYQEVIKNKQFVCGWYHSHPSYGCFMSNDDVYTHSIYQTFWPESVALVIDPYLIDGTSAGFEIYRANLKTKEWYPLLYRIKGSLDVQMLPELLKFLNPIIEGKAIYLEYDED